MLFFVAALYPAASQTRVKMNGVIEMRYLAASVILGLSASQAAAQGLTGASLELTHFTFPDSNEVEATTLSAGIDADLFAGFGLGAGVTRRDQSKEFSASEVIGLTLHGSYVVDQATKASLFVAREDLSLPNNDFEILSYGGRLLFVSLPLKVRRTPAQQETFVGLGAVLAFGPQGGTTFDLYQDQSFPARPLCCTLKENNRAEKGDRHVQNRLCMCCGSDAGSKCCAGTRVQRRDLRH